MEAIFYQSLAKIVNELKSLSWNNIEKIHGILEQTNQILPTFNNQSKFIGNEYDLLFNLAIAFYTFWENIGCKMDEEVDSGGMFLATSLYFRDMKFLGDTTKKVLGICFLHANDKDIKTAKLHAQYANLIIRDNPNIAIEHIEKALQIDSNEDLANYLMGQINRTNGKLAESLSCFEKSALRQPADPLYHGEIAETCVLLYQKSKEKSLLTKIISAYKNALRYQEGNKHFLFGLVKALYEAGQKVEAASYGQIYVSRFPETHSANWIRKNVFNS